MSLRITWDGVRSWAAQSCSNACFLRGSMRSVKRAVFFSTCPRRRRRCRTLTCDEHLIPLLFPWRPTHPEGESRRRRVRSGGAVGAKAHVSARGLLSARLPAKERRHELQHAAAGRASGGSSVSEMLRAAGVCRRHCGVRNRRTPGSAPATSPSFPASRRRRVAAGTRPDPGHRSPRAPCPRTARTSSCAGRGSRP